jgi:hypothetical protein
MASFVASGFDGRVERALNGSNNSSGQFGDRHANYDGQLDSTLSLQPLALRDAARALDEAAAMLRNANTTKVGAIMRDMLKDARSVAR